MITTRLYRLNISDIDWQTAHIFEHVLLAYFRPHLEAHGTNSDLYGWVNGETFSDQLFISGGFYNSKAATIFDDYINRLPVFSKATIQHAIQTVESEERKIITVNDWPLLLSQFDELRQRDWNNHETKTSVKSVALNEKRDAAMFRSLTIGIGSAALSPDEIKLLCRFQVIISDMVENRLQEQYATYTTGRSELLEWKDGHAFFTRVTFKRKAATIKDITSASEKSLRQFDVAKNWADIQKHFETFAHEPDWQTLAVTYFKHTGVTTSNSEIAALATQKNIARLFQKLHIQVFEDHPETDKLLD